VTIRAGIAFTLTPAGQKAQELIADQFAILLYIAGTASTCARHVPVTLPPSSKEARPRDLSPLLARGQRTPYTTYSAFASKPLNESTTSLYIVNHKTKHSPAGWPRSSRVLL
jgi:hypothetical protein